MDIVRCLSNADVNQDGKECFATKPSAAQLANMEPAIYQDNASKKHNSPRGKSLIESWVTTFLPY